MVFYDNKKVKELYHEFIGLTYPDKINNFNWLEKFYELVYEMSKHSGYKNLSMEEIKDFYHPESLRTHYPQMTRYYTPTPPSPKDLEESNKE